MSFKPEVTTNNGIEWAGNATRFATEAEAQDYVMDLRMRWTSVRDTRVVETDDPVTCTWTDQKLFWHCEGEHERS